MGRPLDWTKASSWDFEPLDTTEAGCRAVVAHLLAQADPATELKKAHDQFRPILERSEKT